MAGEKIQKEIYCWDWKSDGLKLYLASSNKGAVRVGFHTMGLNSLEYFTKIYPGKKVIKNRENNMMLIKALKAALRGEPYGDDLPLDISGTPFQLIVWEEISRISFGETRTYGDVAKGVGKPGGARAIGQVMNKNPLPLIFP